MNTDPIIIKNVTKFFQYKTKNHQNKNLEKKQNFLVLNNISFEVKKGEVLGIIGSNGSGKTTLLRIISGIYTPNTGTVSIHGRLSPLLQLGTGFHNEFIAKDNIIMYGMLLGLKKEVITSKIPDIINFAELEKFSKMKLIHFSNGMKMRLAFSTALHVDPDILLVDEVLSVGDEAFRKKSFEAFRKFKDKGKTILFTSHNLNAISKICDRVLLLNEGVMVAIGKADDVIKQYKEILKISK